MNFHPLRRVVDRLERPYSALLVALTSMLLVYPFMGIHRILGWIFSFIMLGVVVEALRSTHGRGLSYRLGWILGLSTFLAGFLSRALGMGLLYPVSVGLRGLFFSCLIVMILSDIFRRHNVTFDAVMGASCVLVLLGLAFGSAFALMEWMVPGSFHVPALPASIEAVFGPTSTEFDLMYFSFVALTTIGFGDVVPIAPMARGLASIEGLLAQLYLTIIVARLVGLEIAWRHDGLPGGEA